MTSKQTTEQIVAIMVDWCHGDPNTMNDLLTLLDKIRAVKGSKSFRDSIRAIYSGLEYEVSFEEENVTESCDDHFDRCGDS